MRWNFRSLILPGVIAACAAVAFPCASPVQAATPIRDPDHTFEKNVCTYKQIKLAHIVMQNRDYSCGAAALATILVYFWGDNVTEDQILISIEKILTPEEMKDRIKNGLAISDIRQAAVDMGYLSSIGTMTFQKLTESKVPLIVGITHNKHNHFVVYRGVDCTWVYLADPIRGNIRVPFAEFVSEWQKNAVLVVAKPDQDPPKTSPLTVYSYEVRRGELNKQVIRTQPEKMLSFPGP
jgi:uncharacterized protein